MPDDPQHKTTPRAGALVEREWSDERGTHYEARIVCRDGTIVSQIVTKLPLTGWPKERQEAGMNVHREALRHG